MPNQIYFNENIIPALMFTDIAGFSDKLAEDELRALELLKTHDALIRVLTAKFEGKILKSVGDSVLVEFKNSVNAVKCALEIQKRFWHFNTGKSKIDNINVRVGIHKSETTVRHEDIISEDITITSRIEALTEQNRICISSDIYNSVKDIIPIKAFFIGQLELKDITRKIEVYELLIDSIPELAKPSATANNLAVTHKTDMAVKQEAEEVNEAKRIEELKKKMNLGVPKGDDEIKRKIALHYTRAETFFEIGDIEKAEQELAIIAKLDPQSNKTLEQPKQENEAEKNERIVQSYLNKARDYILNQDLDAAEKEINLVFRLFPLHSGAQQLLMQIEEERYRLEEIKKASEIQSAVKQKTEEEIKIEELLEQAKSLLKDEMFLDATFVLHDIFQIDPNHSGARRLEETINQAKNAKEELKKIESEQSAVIVPTHDIESLKLKIEDHKKTIKREKKKSSHYTFSKKSIKIVAIVLFAIFLIYGVVKVLDYAFPKKVTIAVLKFSSTKQTIEDSVLCNMLPAMLSEDFGQCDNVTVISYSSSSTYHVRIEKLQNIATELSANYLISGSIDEQNGKYTFTINLFTPEGDNLSSFATIVAPISALGKVRENILSAVIQKIDVKTKIPAISPTANIEVLWKYLQGTNIMYMQKNPDIEETKQYFIDAITNDKTFCQAYSALAEMALRTYLSTEDTQSLQLSAKYAQQGLQCSSTNALAHLVLAKYHRLSQNYSSALSSLMQSMVISRQNAECYRELIYLALAAKKFNEANTYSQKLLILDPKNTETNFVCGLAKHMQKDYTAAENFYQKAQEDDLLVANYIQNVWIALGAHEKVIRYCLQMLRKEPDNYRYYYWIGRAYQLSLQISVGQEWLEKGLAVAEQAIDEDENDAMAHAYTGLIYSRLGKFAEGEAAMKKALKLDPNSSEILFRNANLYAIQRKQQAALDAFDKALKRLYDYGETLNPDLSYIADDTEFVKITTINIDGSWPKK